MRRLCQSELHKFFHSRLHCAMLCVLLLFPLLHLAFTQHAQTQQRYALLGDTVLNEKEAKATADDLRRSMSGTVQKSWVAARKQELEKLVKQGIDISAIKRWIRRTGTATVLWKCGTWYDRIRRLLPLYDRICKHINGAMVHTRAGSVA